MREIVGIGLIAICVIGIIVGIVVLISIWSQVYGIADLPEEHIEHDEEDKEESLMCGKVHVNRVIDPLDVDDDPESHSFEP